MDPSAIRALVDTFNAAWGAHDLDAALALTTDDCLFDATGPAPDGTTHKGRDAVRAAWAPIFADAAASFTTEDTFVADDRFVQTWRYDFEGGHIRGIDVIERPRRKDQRQAQLREGVKTRRTRSCTTTTHAAFAHRAVHTAARVCARGHEG